MWFINDRGTEQFNLISTVTVPLKVQTTKGEAKWMQFTRHPRLAGLAGRVVPAGANGARGAGGAGGGERGTRGR